MKSYSTRVIKCIHTEKCMCTQQKLYRANMLHENKEIEKFIAEFMIFKLTF